MLNAVSSLLFKAISNRGDKTNKLMLGGHRRKQLADTDRCGKLWGKM